MVLVQTKTKFLKKQYICMHTNVLLFNLYQSSLYRIFTHSLMFYYSCMLSGEKLLCCVQNVPGDSDKVCPAVTIRALWVRFYDLLAVAL
jgi:hypothetical protein